MLSDFRRAARAVTVALLWVATNALWPSQGQERESIWSVSKANAQLFFSLTFALWTAALTLLSLDEWAKAPPATLPGVGYFVETVLTRFTKFGLGLTMASILLTVVIAVIWRLLMALADVINRKWVEPQKEKYFAARSRAIREDALAKGREAGHEEGHEEGRKAGHEEGREAGRKAERIAWRDWVSRRDAAIARGEPFDEPAPDER